MDGNTRIGALANFCLSRLNAISHASVHTKGSDFLSGFSIGSVIEAYLPIKHL